MGVIRRAIITSVTMSQSQGNIRVDRAHIEGRSIAGLRLRKHRQEIGRRLDRKFGSVQRRCIGRELRFQAKAIVQNDSGCGFGRT
jgi:hypothetical protein